MLSKLAQIEVNEHLRKVCKIQVRIRKGEIEGMVMNIERKLEVAHSLGLIDFYQFDELISILDGT